MSQEKVTIVDESDQVIGAKLRSEMTTTDIYRVSALWLEDSSGRILLAQRAFSKEHHPGMWGPAAAGTLEAGETYESNIIKETEEELGLIGLHFEKSLYQFNDKEYRHFTQWFLALTDRPLEDFNIQKEEVAQIRWFTKAELLDKIQKHPNNFLPGMQKWLTFFNTDMPASLS